MNKILSLLVLVITVSCSAIATLPSYSSTKTPSLQPSSFTQLKYPNHESCKIQVDTQKWELTEEGTKSIVSYARIVPILYKRGIGSILFVKHRYYNGCGLSWIINGYRDVAQTSLETINGKTWKVWGIETLSSKVYVWPALKEIQFVQKWPLDIPEKESCQADIYEILGSLQCK